MSSQSNNNLPRLRGFAEIVDSAKPPVINAKGVGDAVPGRLKRAYHAVVVAMSPIRWIKFDMNAYPRCIVGPAWFASFGKGCGGQNCGIAALRFYGLGI